VVCRTWLLRCGGDVVLVAGTGEVTPQYLKFLAAKGISGVGFMWRGAATPSSLAAWTRGLSLRTVGSPLDAHITEVKAGHLSLIYVLLTSPR
jgi:hypothetical protein